MISLYGNFRNRKFTDIYENADAFLYDFNNIGIPTKITEDNATTLFYLLYANYGNSVIATSDENRFKYKLFSIIYEYGPTWEYRLKIQDKIRDLIDDENQLLAGAEQIYNSSANPGQVIDENLFKGGIRTVNQQNVSIHKRNKLDAYGYVQDLLKTNVTGNFLKKFKELFLKFVEPEEPPWYVTEDEE